MTETAGPRPVRVVRDVLWVIGFIALYLLLSLILLPALGFNT